VAVFPQTLNFDSSPRRRVYRTGKRLIDILVAGTALLLLLPLMAIVALLVRFESEGPILFRQRRVGLYGHEFEMLKFRTMRGSRRGNARRDRRLESDRREAERRASDRRQAQLALPEGVVDRRQGDRRVPVMDRRTFLRRSFADDRRRTHKSRWDPRVTRVGRILRRTSLDELPQLWNVLKGEMSLVGPRPELPQIVMRYEEWQHARHLVTPGLTGWWQVNRDGKRLMHEATELDLYYVQNQGFTLDFAILLRTVRVVLLGTGSF
jgi:lipopolysaccharide/colanic/teichoic acid biosynthesis glycosyltransferase